MYPLTDGHVTGVNSRTALASCGPSLCAEMCFVTADLWFRLKLTSDVLPCPAVYPGLDLLIGY